MSRTNIYAEEITDRIEIIEKETKDGKFTGLRIYLELPVTVNICKRCGVVEDYTTPTCMDDTPEARFVQIPHEWVPKQLKGPFMHHPGDDDSSAVTFWGKKDLREVLKRALKLLDFHYDQRLHGTVEIPVTALRVEPEPIAFTASFASALECVEIIGRKMDAFKNELSGIEAERRKSKAPDFAREREISCRAALGALAMVRDEIRGPDSPPESLKGFVPNPAGMSKGGSR